MRQVVDDEPVPPSRLVPRVPRDLETICLKCLHKDPARRYPSAQALGDDLYRYLHGQVIHARPAPLWERAAKWSKRHPLATVSLAAGTIILASLIGGGFAYERHLGREELRQATAALADENNGSGLIDDARNRTSSDDLTNAKIKLATFREKIRSEPRLQGLRDRIDNAITRVDAKLAELKAMESRLAGEQAHRKRLDKFRELLKQANVHGIQLTGLDLATNQDTLRHAAREALALYATPGSGESWALDVGSAGLTGPEQAEVAEACYGLMLSLAEAEPSPDQALHRLDEAARSRPTATMAFHLRRQTAWPAPGARPTPVPNARRPTARRPSPRSITS